MTSIEKIPKISVSGQNSIDLFPLFEKGLADKNVGISYLIVSIKFVFFKISKSPYPISSDSILSIEVAPNLKLLDKLETI